MPLSTQEDILKNIPKEMKKKFKRTQCCIKLPIEWIKRPVDQILCSNKASDDECIVEIKIFKATIYRKCLKRSIQDLVYLLNVDVDNTRISQIKTENKKNELLETAQNLGMIMVKIVLSEEKKHKFLNLFEVFTAQNGRKP